MAGRKTDADLRIRGGFLESDKPTLTVLDSNVNARNKADLGILGRTLAIGSCHQAQLVQVGCQYGKWLLSGGGVVGCVWINLIRVASCSTVLGLCHLLSQLAG
ncbi:MAG: hypothetical protein CMJ20_02775 [Phycisphaeraceae bacterium]|nr:hypothetical protein [Phycisphaeraceae bacterium]